jgi:hypothetical protein
MAEPTQFMFKIKDLTTLLLKEQGIHEGTWQILFNFGLGAANVGPTEAEVAPAAIVPVLGIGIQKVPERGPLTVDAAEVNPPK